MSEQLQDLGQSSKQTYYPPEAKGLPPISHLPLRKRLALESTIKTPKKQFVKQLQLEQQLRQVSTRTSPECPLTPGSHSSCSNSSESTVPLIHSPPQHEETIHTAIKKQPLKKAFSIMEAKGKNILLDKQVNHSKLPGNPLLWNNGQVEKYAPEDTIDSFKLAWLNNEKKSLVGKKRGRPPVLKSTMDNDSINRKKATLDGKLYCICKQPYDITRFMIACDRCDDWFHGECIHINEKESEFVDLYFCNKCAKITGKKTSWKAKCANPACHKAAQSSKISKYCSDVCGMQVARAWLELIEMKRRNSIESNVSIAELTLQKQRQLRVNSFADKQDRDRLIEIRQEKVKIRDTVMTIDSKSTLLSQLVQPKDTCGFDDRLIWSDLIWKQPPKDFRVCQHHDCILHQEWQSLIGLEFQQERKEQIQILIRLETETDQIKSRMRKRRNQQEMLKDLINGTLEA